MLKLEQNANLEAGLRQWSPKKVRHSKAVNGSAEVTPSLPAQWRHVYLGQLLELQPGYAFKSSWFAKAGTRLLRGTNLVPGSTRWDDAVYLSADKLRSHEQFRLEAGDIVIAMDRPLVSGGLKVARLASSDVPAYLVQRVGRFKLTRHIYAGYLHWFLNSSSFIEHITGQATGTQLPHISQHDIESAKIPLPPLDEQKRIADKLDILLGRLTACRERLEKVPVILKRFRQSVLAAATSGRLTEDWREKHGIASGTEYVGFSFNDAECLGAFTFPKCWRQQRLGEISDIAGGATKHSDKESPNDEEIPYLRVANVQRGYLDLTELKTIRVPSRRLNELLLQRGDILFNEGGDLDKLGRGWIWSNEVNRCIHQNHVFRARLHDRTFEPKFFSFYGNTRGYDYFVRFGKQTTNLASINKSILTAMPVVVPSAEEQQEIIRRLDNLFHLADSLDRCVESAKEKVRLMSPSILQRAFAGRLLEPQLQECH